MFDQRIPLDRPGSTAPASGAARRWSCRSSRTRTSSACSRAAPLLGPGADVRDRPASTCGQAVRQLAHRVVQDLGATVLVSVVKEMQTRGPRTSVAVRVDRRHLGRPSRLPCTRRRHSRRRCCCRNNLCSRSSCSRSRTARACCRSTPDFDGCMKTTSRSSPRREHLANFANDAHRETRRPSALESVSGSTGRCPTRSCSGGNLGNVSALGRASR